MFEPIRTERLLIRGATTADAADLAARRSDPEVARYQNWTIPYPLERAEAMLAEIEKMDGPQNDEWWMAVVCHAGTGQTLGDLVVHLSWQRRTAEVGYTFATEHWGRGYANEALAALVAWLFEDLEVTRVFGMLHPDNRASAMVLERVGMLFEGHTRSSFWLGEDCSDDWIYGMTRPDWDAWRARPATPPESVRLVEVTAANLDEVFSLRTHKTQEWLVAPMSRSLAQALFPEIQDGQPLVPWLRAIEADGEMVGFLMLAERTKAHPEPYLWRLLIDRMHQRRGIGATAVRLVADQLRSAGEASLLTSWVEGKGSPRDFYLGLGFQPTGRIVDEETEGRLDLA